MSSLYTPQQRRAERFEFGLWTVGNVGRDPFGEASREGMPPWRRVEELGALGASAVALHDNDLIPMNATQAERDDILGQFTTSLRKQDMVVGMASCNLFYHRVFRDGAFTASDPKVRAFALQKTMKAIDLGAELGAKVFVFWGGREGAEVDAARDPAQGFEHYRKAINFLCKYVKDQGYPMTFAIEPKPNEPRSDIYLPTIGACLAFITTLDHPEMVEINGETAHTKMAGLNHYHEMKMAFWMNKCNVHQDLNGQKPLRYDQDFKFGSDDPFGSFFHVKMNVDHEYTGWLNFDAHAHRTTSDMGVYRDFAAGNMDNYLMMKEKVAQFDEDRSIQDLYAEINAGDVKLQALMDAYSAAAVGKLRELPLDPEKLADRELKIEALENQVLQLLLGKRD